MKIQHSAGSAQSRTDNDRTEAEASPNRKSVIIKNLPTGNDTVAMGYDRATPIHGDLGLPGARI